MSYQVIKFDKELSRKSGSLDMDLVEKPPKNYETYEEAVMVIVKQYGTFAWVGDYLIDHPNYATRCICYENPKECKSECCAESAEFHGYKECSCVPNVKFIRDAFDLKGVPLDLNQERKVDLDRVSGWYPVVVIKRIK